MASSEDDHHPSLTVTTVAATATTTTTTSTTTTATPAPMAAPVAVAVSSATDPLQNVDPADLSALLQLLQRLPPGLLTSLTRT